MVDHYLTSLSFVNDYGYEISDIKCAEFTNETGVYLERCFLVIEYTNKELDEFIETLNEKKFEDFATARIWFHDGSWMVKVKENSWKLYSVPAIPRHLMRPGVDF